MLVFPTFLIFVSLSVVVAIPLGSRENGQTPHIRGIPSLIPLPKLPIPVPVPVPEPASLFKSLKGPSIFKRFIMGADYASSSAPFLGKSSHKRDDPLSGVLGSTTLHTSDLEEESPLNLSSRSTPT
jgi:hypothetical protein